MFIIIAFWIIFPLLLNQLHALCAVVRNVLDLGKTFLNFPVFPHCSYFVLVQYYRISSKFISFFYSKFMAFYLWLDEHLRPRFLSIQGLHMFNSIFFLKFFVKYSSVFCFCYPIKKCKELVNYEVYPLVKFLLLIKSLSW